jgi:hypothetical protein
MPSRAAISASVSRGRGGEQVDALAMACRHVLDRLPEHPITLGGQHRELGRGQGHREVVIDGGDLGPACGQGAQRLRASRRPSEPGSRARSRNPAGSCAASQVRRQTGQASASTSR